MTPEPAWSDDRLAELAVLPPDHPEVLAVRADPERWARLVALRAFLEPGAETPGERTDEAVARMRAARKAALDAEAPAPAPASRVIRPAPAPRAWFAGWPALAAAAAVIVAAALFLPRALEHRGTLRGPSEPALAADARIDGDQVVFTWRAVQGAEVYELALLREDLTRLRPVLAVEGTTARVPLAALRTADGAGRTLLWRVTAMRGGAPLAGSETARLDVP